MDEVRCLYFEDDPNQRSRYTEWIERAWNKLKTGIPITIIPSESPEAAINQLRQAPIKFHLFVADILVGTGDTAQALGLSAITYAREDNHNLAIVALSMGNGGFEQRALNAGANEYVSKQYLIDNPRENLLGEKILKALRDCGHEPTSSKPETLLFDEDDFPLNSLIETIGKDNVVNFTVRILNQTCGEIRPSFIRAGLSGASVLKVDCAYEITESGIKRQEHPSILLKISPNSESLSNETSKDISEFPEGLFIRFIADKPIKSGSWYAIASKFKVEGKTFLDWLSRSNVPSERVEDALNSLFLENDRGLREVYQQAGRSDKERPNIVLWNILSLGRRARIRQALDEFKSLADRYTPSNIFDERLIIDFIKSKRIDELNEEDIQKGTSYCLSHGDLHGRNILIGKSFKGYLIDPANIERLHWAADIARLSVDLIVSGWDIGDESYQWNKMAEWLDLSQAFIRGQIPTDEDELDSNGRIRTALNWLRVNLPAIHAIDNVRLKPEWEFRLALAVEFMRAAYRQQDLPAPKRVLGIISACQALRDTCTAYKDFEKTL